MERGKRMKPGERRKIAERVRDKYRKYRKEPKPTIEEVDEVPLEILFDCGLTDLDKMCLRHLGVRP